MALILNDNSNKFFYFIIFLFIYKVVFDFILLENYMVYNNSFNFFIKTLGKELPISIFQFSKRIECSYNLLEYSKSSRYIDVDIKLAMKHIFFQSQLDYINSIYHKKSFNSHDLGFFTNMLVIKGLTSAPAIDLLNIENNEIEKVNATFFADKKICGIIGQQYLSPLTTFIFTEEWSKLTNVLKYEKLLNYDKNFLLNLNKDTSAIAESIWEGKLYSDDYNNKESFLSSFKQLLESQYWIHNYGDFKLYKSPNNYYSYPEIYQVLYNLDFKFNENLNKFEIIFDSLFFDKSLLEKQDLNNYKNFDAFNEILMNWREKGDIIKFTKSCSCLYFLSDKYILDDFLKNDLELAFKKIIKESGSISSVNILILIKSNNFNKLKLFSYLKKKEYLFFYFIPFNETKLKTYNLLLLNTKVSFLGETLTIFDNCDLINDQIKLFKYLLDEIDWENTDLFNHYLWWDKNYQLLISSYLDFVCGGLVFSLPYNWN